MPIYEYRCKSCDHEFEEFVRSGDAEPDTCPECEAPSISRLISNTNFQLKGSGWYETDYARADEEPDGGPDESADEPSEAASDETTPSDDTESSDESADTGQAA